MNVAREITKNRKTNIDAEISATSCNHSDSDWWKEDCYNDKEDGGNGTAVWWRWHFGGWWKVDLKIKTEDVFGFR
jgi:hypothetical protein